jgi:uncharacterized protein (DUF1330 family)
LAAYLVAKLVVTDPEAYEQYRSQVPATIAAYGGRYIVRGGAIDTLEGEAVTERVVILEFPDMAQLKAWYQSAAYRPLIEIRKRSTHSKLFAIEGV